MDSATHENVRELDPFGFWHGHSSAIRPLGGDEPGPDPRYAFHTPYVEFSPGRVLFTIRFDRLQASFGELRVFINAFVPGSGRDAVFVTSSRLDLTDRAATDRGLTISILSVAGASYAAHGMCLEGTDARATGLTITAEQLDAEGVDSGSFLLPTTLGNTELDLSSRLVGESRPRFCDPVSQTMTDDQLTEPQYQHWNSQLSASPADDRSRWRHAFIAQVLDRYGMLRPGARGIALDENCGTLAPVIAAAGCEAVKASLSPEHVSDFSWNTVFCSPIAPVPAPGEPIPSLPLALADQPADARGFDFMWTNDVARLGYEAGHCANFLAELMSMLRPGGYAVHMIDLAHPDARSINGLPRAEVERLAVTLISRGFTVAQLNFTGLAEGMDSLPFGLIVRRD